MQGRTKNIPRKEKSVWSVFAFLCEACLPDLFAQQITFPDSLVVQNPWKSARRCIFTISSIPTIPRAAKYRISLLHRLGTGAKVGLPPGGKIPLFWEPNLEQWDQNIQMCECALKAKCQYNCKLAGSTCCSRCCCCTLAPPAGEPSWSRYACPPPPHAPRRESQNVNLIGILIRSVDRLGREHCWVGRRGPAR